MSETLNAENLTISIPNVGCDKNCEYCISKITGMMNSNFKLMVRNVEKVKKVATAAGVTSVLFTGKGEPTLNIDDLGYFLSQFKEWPCELQTNGIMLLNNYDKLGELFFLGLDTVAVSMDNEKQFEDYIELFKNINNSGLTSRITVNLTNKLLQPPLYYIEYCIKNNIRQLTFRRVSIPRHYKEENKQVKWIIENAFNEKQFNAFVDECIDNSSKLLRDLSTGIQIYDVNGISFGVSQYCIQDGDKGKLRSLIFQEDGHLYTSWNSDASILF